MPQKLTKQSEERLLSALNDIAELTNDGMHPNEAITKVATELKVPHGHVQLLVNAYNTGRTTAQRKSSDDIWSKSAEFPIADSSVILENMYPTEPKQAQFSSVSQDYSSSPNWLHRRKEAQAKEWAKTVDIRLCDKPTDLPRDDDYFYKKAKAEARSLKLDVEEARRRARYAFDYATQQKEEIVQYFKQANHQPFQEVRQNSVLKWGDNAKILFDQIAEENPAFCKQASTGRHTASGWIFDKVHSALLTGSAYVSLQRDYAEKRANYEVEEAKLLSPFVNQQLLSNQQSQLPLLVHSMVNGFVSKQAGLSSWIGGVSKDIASAKLKEQTANPYAKVQQQRLEDQYKHQFDEPNGGHSYELDALNQESMLSDLLSSDEVLSHHDPHQVLSAYANIKALAPRAAGNPDLLRTLLRDKLEKGQQSLFDLETLTKVEKNLGQINKGQYGGGDNQ